MERILYLSDLDGTLLGKNQMLSPRTEKILTGQIHKGLLFSFATARSLYTAGPIMKGISVRLPAIVYNGAFLVECETKTILKSNFFPEEQAQVIFQLLQESGISPITYSILDNRERFSFHWESSTESARKFIASRSDQRKRRVDCLESLLTGDAFYFTCIDQAEKLRPIYETLKDVCTCLYQKEVYTGEQWLEILPGGVSKSSAALALKELLGCTKIISFGDGENDIPLFQASDECYAVENAHPALKAIASGIIESNDKDGVALWLERHGKTE